MGAWLSVTPLVHDIAYMRDGSGADGRFHHVAFWMDDFSDLIRAADILREAGTRIEAGPAKHAITNGLFLYLYEPGGNRLELFSGGYLIFAPDWRPVTWTEEDRDLRVWCGGGGISGATSRTGWKASISGRRCRGRGRRAPRPTRR